MSTSLRTWFDGPAPSAPRTGDESEFSKTPPSSDDPPVAAFGVVRMDIEEVDYVDLANNQRQLYLHRDQAWSEEALNP